MEDDNVIDIKGRIPLKIEPLDKNKELRFKSGWVQGDSVFLEMSRGNHTFHKKEKFSLQLSKRGFYVKMESLDTPPPVNCVVNKCNNLANISVQKEILNGLKISFKVCEKHGIEFGAIHNI